MQNSHLQPIALTVEACGTVFQVLLHRRVESSSFITLTQTFHLHAPVSVNGSLVVRK